MKITHILAMSTVFAGATLGSAATAIADDGLHGSYLYKLANGRSAMWNFTTTCSPTCVAQVTLPDGNVHQANLANGQWTMEANVADAAICNATGAPLAGTVRYTWVARTLTGLTLGTFNRADCGGGPAVQATSLPSTFTLTKVS